ncbi:MAG: discoidin domain-containing protein [Clostridia bacterium]|nr:discoidin domain-containing protein [Clostridia bacterium]
MLNLFAKKMLCRGVAWLLCTLMLVGVILPVLPVSAAETDIARGKTAIACHSESDALTPEKALDGNSSSRYAAGGACLDDTWYILDLGNNYDVTKVRINWEAAHPSVYVLEISSDGQTYTQLKKVENAAAGWVETAVSGTGRFLRIREVTRALAQYGMSMWDLEVYGTPAATQNTAVYHRVEAGTVRNGTLTLSREGLVPDGTQVTLTVTPMEGGNLIKLTKNGKDVTADVKDGTYTFTADGEAIFDAEFTAAPTDRFECEDALVFAADGVTPISVTRLADGNASGKAVAGSTGGKYFIFENVKESNCIHIAYASPHTNNMNLYVRYPGETEFRDVGLIPFSTSNSWDMDSSYIAVSPMVYIPAGSDIKIRPNVDCNLDCLWVTNESAGTASDAPAGTLAAATLSDQAEDDVMATYAKAVKLSKGQSVTFTVPAVGERFNVLSLSYRAEASSKVAVKKGSTLLGSLEVGETLLRTYEGTGMRTEAYAAGDSLTLTVTEGELWLDYVTVNFAPDSDVVTVASMPAKGERLTVSLDGTWAIGAQRVTGTWKVPAAVPAEVEFINSIPVPGLWHSAAYDLGAYAGTMSWYKKTVVLEEVPTGQALLYIGSAQYGRHIYVNGAFVGSYEYNYSHSYTDITDYLKKGENEIVIMLGAWSIQFGDPDTVAHVLYDGESCEDEPGITDSVELIFHAAPEVYAVQTNPDIDKGSVQVQVTLQNRSDKVVTSDVVISIYELGVFENGVPNQKEVKVGEYTQKGVKVNKDGTTTFTVDAVTLEGWTKDKCWSPDSPFLYRIEVETDGDTYTTRFGMRTFDFDPVTKYARLNGEIFYLFGTNVAIERYFDDPLCGTTPWEEDWIRKLYSEFKDVNWSCFRTHLGHANSKWFDIADEMGIMIFDEYAIWGDADGCTIDTIMPEIYAWIDARANHPSLIVFDAQNESAAAAFTDEVIRRGREYDLQKRPWENGWRAPVSDTDPVECHPYIIGSQGISGLNNMTVSKPIVTTADIGWTADRYPNNPYIINEHGEYWINREGAAMSGTAGTWNNALPGATNEERLAYYAELMAAQMEAFRTERAYVGILFFCGLGSSFPSAQGVTSDILSPDVSTAESLQIRPYTKELLKNAFADLGIVIDEYTEEVKRGEKLRLPIVLVNDTGKDIVDLPVTIKIMSGDTVLYAERITMSVSAFSADSDGLARETLAITVPAYRDYCGNRAVLTVTASYELEGETVYSQRKWTVKGGDLSDDPIPTYDWLVEEETQPDDTQPDETQSAETDDATAFETDAVSEVTTAADTAEQEHSTLSETSEAPEQKGCASTISMAALLLTAGGALALAKKRERRVDS